MRLTGLIRGSVTGIGAAAVLLLSSGVAQAEPAAELTHCVINISDTVSFSRCYASEAAADRDLNLPYTLFRAWDGYNRTGKYSLRLKSSSTCTAAYDNQREKWPNLSLIPLGATRNWDNAISSWETNYSCRVRFYYGYNYTGDYSQLSHTGVDCPDMRTCFGAGEDWNNRAGSFGLT